MPPYKRAMVPYGSDRVVRRRTAGYRSSASAAVRRIARAANYRVGPGPVTGLSTLNPTPDRMVTKLAYYQSYSFSAPTIQDAVFSLNSLFDPDITGGGHQPRGFDQWANFYSRYRVIGVKVILDASVSDADNSAFNVGLIPSGTSSTTRYTDGDYPLENPRAFYKSMTGLMGGPVRLVANYLPWQILGVTKERYMSDDAYGALTSTSPAIQPTLHTFVASMPAGETSNIAMAIKLIYTVQFEQRVAVGPS